MYPKLFGENGWTMNYQPYENMNNRIHGPTLCQFYFGRMIEAIEAIAKAFPPK